MGKPTLQSLIWRIQTAAFKRRISLEDRFGWYRYSDWIRDCEKAPAFSAEEDDPRQVDGAEPRFSLILRTGEGSITDLLQTLSSFYAQTFTAWEALVVLSQEFAGLSSAVADRRVQFHQAGETNQLSDRIPATLEDTNGDLVLALDSGDTIPPSALAEVAHTFSQTPELEIIYTDEDRLAGSGGIRQDPFFKPDWSPELLLSINYLQHAFFSRRLLIQALASTTIEEPTWDDLVFACAGRARRIFHIPRVLYHRCSTSFQVPQAQIHTRPLEAYLEGKGIPEPTAKVVEGGTVRVIWRVRGDRVSIIIPTRDRVEYLEQCVESITKITTYPDYEIILVDSGSIEPKTAQYYAKAQAIPNLRLLHFEGLFNFSKALNLGAREAQGAILLFLNNDTEAITDGWLSELVRWAEIPEIGVVGGQLRFPDGSIQHAGIVIGMEGHASHVFGEDRPDADGPFGSAAWYRNYSAVTGACMAMRKDVFDEIGGFDEGYQLAFSDIEICLRTIQAGYRVMYTPFARMIHHEGKTRQRFIPTQDIARAYLHLKDIVAGGDPYFNPNLSTAVRIPTFRRPGEEAAIDRLREIVTYLT
jgi:GT2 family glycosyltransferase